MGLQGKESKQFPIKCNEKLVYELFMYGTNHVSKLAREIEGCDLIEGEWGAVDSIICWHFSLDGKKVSAKEEISAVDDKKNLIEFKVIEGELLKAYKSFFITLQISNNSVTVSVEYEKRNENIPNPTSLLDLIVREVRDVDNNHQDIPRLVANN